MKRKPWGDAEIATLRKHYPTLGASGMLRAGYLADRSVGSLTKCASLLGLVCDTGPRTVKEVPVPLPRMDPPESLECVRLAKWRGPVDRNTPLRCAA